MKAIIITGVGKGFGRSLMLGLREEFFVIGVTRSASDLESLSSELEGGSNRFALLQHDVCDVVGLWDKVLEILSGKNLQLYGLINNAGMRCRREFLEISPSLLDEVLRVNLVAPFALSQRAIPIMLENHEGVIINISSILSKSALPDLSAYATSKGGLDSLTQSIAVEFGSRGIRVNSILPGFCMTSYYDSFRENEDLYQMTLKRTPAGRWGKSSELVGLCRFLLSDDGSYVNGAMIPLDGGWLAA